jgi:hypothetical protein
MDKAVTKQGTVMDMNKPDAELGMVMDMNIDMDKTDAEVGIVTDMNIENLNRHYAKNYERLKLKILKIKINVHLTLENRLFSTDLN